MSARRRVKFKPQQPDGCEDLDKPDNEAIASLFPFVPVEGGSHKLSSLFGNLLTLCVVGDGAI